jgi:glycosyltransferase involved in cell wall biosynthesis
MPIRLLILTDKYPIDVDRSPTVWMLAYLRSLGGVADVTVVSLVRMLPRLKNLMFGGYDRRWFRAVRTLPKVEQPFPHVTVYHRRCITLPDQLGWQMNPRLLVRQQRRWIHALMRSGGYDAVLLVYLHAAAPLARIAARFARIPLWIEELETLGSMSEEGQGTLHRWMLAQIASADMVISHCSVQKAELQLAFPGKPIRVIPLAIDDVVSSADSPEVPPLRCICASRLDQRTKHVDKLLRAIASVRNEDGTDLRLTVVGDGFLRRKLQLLAHELGIADAVSFAGWRPLAVLREMLRSQHFAVQPSEHESFGLVALEAAAAGLPLIAVARAGVVPDLASAGAALRTVKRSSPEEIARAIRDVRDRLPDLHRQAIEARGRIRERFSWEEHAARYAALFRTLEK